MLFRPRRDSLRRRKHLGCWLWVTAIQTWSFIRAGTPHWRIEELYQELFHNDDGQVGNRFTSCVQTIVGYGPVEQRSPAELTVIPPISHVLVLSLNPVIFAMLHKTVELKYDGDNITYRCFPPHFHSSISTTLSSPEFFTKFIFRPQHFLF